MIRTTETGGLKVIYNGEPVNGKCESTREDHLGFYGYHETFSDSLDSPYLYGSSFTYDFVNNTYTLVDTEMATWSDSTYEDLLGKFTCKNTTGTCSSIDSVNVYYSNTDAYNTTYDIDLVNYAEIGRSAYNPTDNSIALVGYMFNKRYYQIQDYVGNKNYKYGSSFTYDSGTNTYTLSGTIKDITDWSTEYDTLDNIHYTCMNTSGSCSIISYVYYTDSWYTVSVRLTGGKGINDVLDEMLYSNDVNKYSSGIKSLIDNWYLNNLSDYTSMLEDTVYCNNRIITELAGWNPTEAVTDTDLGFVNSEPVTSLVCPNLLDQFSVSNNKAKLTYPIGLLQSEEVHNINNASLLATGHGWWNISPFGIHFTYTGVMGVDEDGGDEFIVNIDHSSGVRPVISLASFNAISSGTGSEIDPWIVE